MKWIYHTILTMPFILLIAGCAGQYTTEKSRGETIYIGKVDRALFDRAEMSWFKEGYNNYTPNSEVLDSIRTSEDSLMLVVFLGTWCPDTHRELPRLMKILETKKLPIRILTFDALDREKNGGGILAEIFNVKLVPTFIFLRNGREVGRIVEEPQKSLEEDIKDFFKQSR